MAEIGEFVKIVNVPIVLYWDSEKALDRDRTKSGSWRNTGNHRVINKVTSDGVTVYAIKDTSDSYLIGWVREDDLGSLGVNTEQMRTYVVRAGDTLWKIAQQFGVTVNDLRAWNGIAGDLINIGQMLIVGQGGTTITTETKDGIETKPVNTITMEIDGKVIELKEGINNNLFELPVGATEVKLKGNGTVKFRYRPEVMG